MDAPPNHVTGPSHAIGAARAAPLGGFGNATAGKIGMWVFLATDTMGFAGLLFAYAVLRARSDAWPDPALRTDRVLAAMMTFALLISGATMSAAVAAARRGDPSLARVLIVTTALAGLAFLGGQTAEFHALLTVKHLGLTADHAASTFTLITTYHGLHVMVGVVVLAVMASRREIWRSPGQRRPGAGSAHRRADIAGVLEVTSLYWQFVDVVWIVLFTVLYLLPPVVRD